MSGEIKALVGNVDALYGLLSGRDEETTFSITGTQVLAALALSAGGFFARILTDPLFTAQVGASDVALVASIWMVWAAAAGLVLVLTRMGGQGGAAVIGLCLAGAAVSLTDVLTPGFLLPVNSFVLIQLALALFGLSLSFRLVPQIAPGGPAARWADRFGTHALPLCALALFIATTPVQSLLGDAGAHLAERRASVEAGRVAAGGTPDLRDAAAVSLSAGAAGAVLARPDPAGLETPVTAQIHPDARAALALLLLTIGNSSTATQGTW